MGKTATGSRHADGQRKSGAQVKRERNQASQLRKEEVAKRELLFDIVQHDTVFHLVIKGSTTLDQQYTVAHRIFQIHRMNNLEPLAHRHSVKLFNDFLTWASRSDVSPKLNEKLKVALGERDRRQNAFKSSKKRLKTEGFMASTSFDKASFLRGLHSYSLARLTSPYPPADKFISESNEIWQRNKKFVHGRKLADIRIPRKYMHHTDISRLKFDTKENQSVLFYCGGELVLVVIRNACKREQLVRFIDDSVSEVIASRTSIRKEDVGHMSQMGLSAGSRSGGTLDWVKNVSSRKSEVGKHNAIDYRASSSFAALWQLSQALLPDEIIIDFASFLEQMGSDARMDGHGSMNLGTDGRGEFSIDIGSTSYTFHGAELAPPAGVMAANYCRHVHNEKQPHKWSISFTTNRTWDKDFPSVDAGGHFYIAEYGIRVRAAANTLIAWQPKDWHGTSLPLMNPVDSSKEYHQRGLAFVTSSRLPRAIKLWREGKKREAEDELLVGEGHSEHELDSFVSQLRRSERLAGKVAKE